MTNKSISRALKETAALLELSGGNPFRSRAFENAARTIERLEEPVAELLEAGTLTELPGIGQGLAAQIGDLLARGSFDLRDELIASLPIGLPELLRVKGLGTKKVRQLWQQLDITTLEQLEEAATVGRLADLPGFGARTQEKVLEEVRRQRAYRARRRYASTLLNLQPVLNRLRAATGVTRAELSGQLRRQLETVDRAEILVAGTDPQQVRTAAAEWITEAPDSGPDGTVRLVGDLADGLPLEVTVVAPSRFGTTWWRQTGSPEHVEAFVARFGEPDVHADEERIFESAGLAFIHPALREDARALYAAARGELPALIAVEDLRGTLHNHTTYSDGAHTLEQMAGAALARGLEYFGVCDHSQSLTIAHGMSVETLEAQQEEIRALNAGYAGGAAPFRILSGIESDILADGSLDYPDEVLASFDFIVASVHSGFNMTEREATERVVTAIENPYTTILGHATGRLLLAREGYPLDHERIIDACAANGVALELNANPYRLDVDWRWLRRATERGVLISINPDAHSMEELDNVQWGVSVAQKGWLTAEQCLNAMPLEALTAWLVAHRAARPR